MAAIVIRRGDLEIEVRDSTDLRSVLDALGERQLQLPLAQEPPDGQGHNPKPLGAMPTEQAFRKFYRDIKGKSTQRFVDALYKSTLGLSDSQVRNILGFSTNFELAGVSSALVKSERKAGLPDRSAVQRERRGTVGDYIHRYWITSACRQAIAPLVSQVQENGEAPN